MDVLIGWPGGDWQATARLGSLLFGAYLLILWLATILWVYRDTQARTREPAAQAIGVALVVVFPLLGVVLYLLVRPRETLAEAYERYLDREALFALVRGDDSGEHGAPPAFPQAPPGVGARPARPGRGPSQPAGAARDGAPGPAAGGAAGGPAGGRGPSTMPAAAPRGSGDRGGRGGRGGAAPRPQAPDIEPYEPGRGPEGYPRA